MFRCFPKYYNLPLLEKLLTEYNELINSDMRDDDEEWIHWRVTPFKRDFTENEFEFALVYGYWTEEYDDHERYDEWHELRRLEFCNDRAIIAYLQKIVARMKIELHY